MTAPPAAAGGRAAAAITAIDVGGQLGGTATAEMPGQSGVGSGVSQQVSPTEQAAGRKEEVSRRRQRPVERPESNRHPRHAGATARDAGWPRPFRLTSSTHDP